MNSAGCSTSSRTRACIVGANRASSALAGDRVELAGNVEIEEGGEARILIDEAKREVARQEVAQRLFAREIGVRTSALDERPTVETLARPPERNDFAALSFLDASLEDDEEAFGRGVPGEDRLAGPEIADIDRRPHDFGLGGRKSVERRVRKVETLRHSPPPDRRRPLAPVEAPASFAPAGRRLAIGESEGTFARRPPETGDDSRPGLLGDACGI